MLNLFVTYEIQKYSCATLHMQKCFYLLDIVSVIVFFLFVCFVMFLDCFYSSYLAPHPVFLCPHLLCCSVTRLRSSLFLVYVLHCFPFACRLRGLMLGHCLCGSGAPQRAQVLCSVVNHHCTGYVAVLWV